MGNNNNQWIIRILLSLSMLLAGFVISQVTVVGSITENKSEIKHNKENITRINDSMEEYINLTKEVVENNRQLIAYLRAMDK